MSPGDAKRQLCGYVDWFLSRQECNLSCKSLREYTDQCDTCEWQPIRKKTFLPYTIGQAQDFLEKAFSKYAQGYTMGRVLAVLLALRDEKGFDKLCVGLRSIRSRLIDGYSINLDPKDLSRALYRLETVGFLRIIKGQAGEFAFRRSNEYTFLRWTPEQVTAPDPQQQTAPPIISHMCGSSQTLCVAP